MGSDSAGDDEEDERAVFAIKLTESAEKRSNSSQPDSGSPGLRFVSTCVCVVSSSYLHPLFVTLFRFEIAFTDFIGN
jgi:hypothetical protein